jgi:hypothetical protein
VFREHIHRPRTEPDGDVVPPVEAEPLPPGQ